MEQLSEAHRNEMTSLRQNVTHHQAELGTAILQRNAVAVIATFRWMAAFVLWLIKARVGVGEGGLRNRWHPLMMMTTGTMTAAKAEILQPCRTSIAPAI